MVLLTSKLTYGQATFIARAIIQILAYAGTFLLGLLVVGHAPRIAHFRTHDVLNRVVGQITLTATSLKWIWRRFRRKSGPVSPRTSLPSSLPIAIALFLTYSLLVTLSDIGLIGVRPCVIPFPSYKDTAASIRSDEDALRVLKQNLNMSADPASINALRCESTKMVTPAPNVSFSSCTQWHNSTWGDSSAFATLNSTDSDVLMPKQLSGDGSSDPLALNYFFRGAKGPRVASPTVTSGLAVVPHQTGVRMIVGVPNLSSAQRVRLPRTMAIEADVGCMALGITGLWRTSLENEEQYEILETTGSWREYVGPDNFYDTLSHHVDIVRETQKPLFNKSSSDGSLVNDNFNSLMSSGSFTFFDRVANSYIHNVNGSINSTITDQIENDCTEALQKKLQASGGGLELQSSGYACHLLQLDGGEITDSIYQKARHALCAVSTEVNMVSVTVETDNNGVPSVVDLVRLPSTLNVVQADFWWRPGGQNWTSLAYWFNGVTRYTLSDDPSGPVNHPIFQKNASLLLTLENGIGSAGNAIAELGFRMITFDVSNEDDVLRSYFGGSFYGGDFSLSRITRLLGEKGATYLLSSVGYNGWAARSSESPTLLVESTGGKNATCYKMAYGVAFLPLFIVALIAIGWAAIVAVRMRGRLGVFGEIKSMYGGLSPLALSAGSPDISLDSLLVWEKTDRPRLELIYDGMVLEGTADQRLAEYINEKPSSPTLDS